MERSRGAVTGEFWECEKKESGIGREGDGGRRFRDAGLGTGFGSCSVGLAERGLGKLQEGF